MQCRINTFLPNNAKQAYRCCLYCEPSVCNIDVLMLSTSQHGFPSQHGLLVVAQCHPRCGTELAVIGCGMLLQLSENNRQTDPRFFLLLHLLLLIVHLLIKPLRILPKEVMNVVKIISKLALECIIQMAVTSSCSEFRLLF